MIVSIKMSLKIYNLKTYYTGFFLLPHSCLQRSFYWWPHTRVDLLHIGSLYIQHRQRLVGKVCSLNRQEQEGDIQHKRKWLTQIHTADQWQNSEYSPDQLHVGPVVPYSLCPGTMGRLTPHVRLTRKQIEGQSETKISFLSFSSGKLQWYVELRHNMDRTLIFNFTLACYIPLESQIFPVFWFPRGNESLLPAASFQKTTVKSHFLNFILFKILSTYLLVYSETQ